MNKLIESKKYSRATIAAWVIAALLAIMYMTEGSRLPYIHTNFSNFVRLYLLAPALIGVSVYAGFVHKWRTGMTGYQMAVQRYPNKEDRIRLVVACLIGIPFISISLAVYSIGVPARMADVVAVDPFTHVFQIRAITERGGPGFTGWFELDLLEPVSGEVVMLPLKRTDYRETMYSEPIWRAGELLCVRGRTSFFGTIIDRTARDVDSC